MAGKQKYYVVWEGHQPGIYTKWYDCRRQIDGYTAAKYKAFTSLEAATIAFRGDYHDYWGKKTTSKLSDREIEALGKPIYPSVSVDAACSGNPGKMEYQGVDTETQAKLFHVGPFPLGTVNIGEFLALVHALAFLKQRHLDLPIYSDSRTAIAWVREKKIRTKLPRNQQTEKLFELTDRAVAWINSNQWENEIIKWETEAWGEIPADFGRK
ncbi:MAG: ribonuclease H [Bacteroidetes bacterium]|nr:MAG: ribonuclease H [Bacteroidota bacterium]PIE88569.1 MAG: ribonuclease H [Bacteroidota bacterium]